VTPGLALAVALGSGIGAVLRWEADRAHARYRERRGLGRPAFPWATLTVNVVGSALLGVVAGLVLAGDLDPVWQTVLGTGVAGGLTTFSTLAFDVVELVREQRYLRSGAVVLLNVALGLAAAVLGYHLVP